MNHLLMFYNFDLNDFTPDINSLTLNLKITRPLNVTVVLPDNNKLKTHTNYVLRCSNNSSHPHIRLLEKNSN